MLKAEEKKTESERNKDESHQNKKWIESVGVENLPVEEWRTNEEWMKNGRKPSRIYSRKRLGSVTEAPQLGFSSRKQFFHPTQLKCIAKGVKDHLEQPPFAYL